MSIFNDLTSDYAKNFTDPDRVAGFTLPSNYTANAREYVLDYCDVPPGSTVTEADWAKDREFEALIEEQYKGTMAEYTEEFARCRKTGRMNTVTHLSNFFDKAYKVVYKKVPGKSGEYIQMGDDFMSTLWQSEGFFRTASY